MKKSLNISVITALLPAFLALTGCEEKIDPLHVDTPEDNIVYVNTFTGDNTYYVNSNTTTAVPVIKQIVQPYPETGAADMKLKLPAMTIRKVESNVEVTFEVDHSLVALYNEANKSATAQGVPEGITVNFTRNKVTIPAGADVSLDSVEMNIVMPVAVTAAMTPGRYVIPLKIASVSGNGVKISSTSSVIFFPFDLTTNTVNNRTSAPAGTAQTSYTGWAVVDSNPALTNPANMLNTTTSTYATLATPQQLTFTVDMASERTNVSGFRIYLSNPAAAYVWSQVKVETSTDYQNWTYQGSPQVSQAGNYYHYVAFNQRVPSARYIRVTVLAWSAATTSFRIAYFQAYW